ncbi:hypothetical protein HQ560_00385 [bacterium]|nr:hypothetical protein [bacterium]
MCGIFQSLVTVGNTRFHRLLGNARTPVNLLRASGQRIFVREGAAWSLLGLPSAYGIGLDRCRWVYKTEAETILVEVSVDAERPVAWTRIQEHLAYPDGFRLMDRPPVYRGGAQRFFRRAETASYFGREIGLMYVHAHLRTMEALAKLGKADDLYEAILKVIPINLREHVPSAAPRQSNAYFSSSDAGFADRYEAGERYGELRTGEIGVKGGWRIYSSGPGIFVGQILTRFLGIRRHYESLVIDPVLPKRLDGLRVGTVIDGVDVEIAYHVVDSVCSPRRVAVNGVDVADLQREPNPYRPGGAVLRLDGLLAPDRDNRIDVWL